MKRFRMLLALFALLCAIALAPGHLRAEDGAINQMQEDIKALKQENEGLKKRLDSVEGDQEEFRHNDELFSRLMEVSGYADVEYALTDQESVNNRFRIKHLSLFFTKDLQKEWKLFSELEFEDAPLVVSNNNTDTVTKSQGLVFLEQMYVQYHPSYDWDLRAGRFLTPAGIWSIYHYPPYVPTQRAPLMFKVIFPEVSDGVVLRKSFPIADNMLDAHFYLANGAGNPGGVDRNDSVSYGTRVNYALDTLGQFQFGASLYRDKDNQGAMRQSYGLHMQYSKGPFKFQTEWAQRHNHPYVTQTYDDTGAYGQITYDIGKWTFAGRADWYDSNSTDPKNDQYRYTGAVNYHFAHNVVGKAEYNYNTFKDPAVKDYSELIFAVAIAIGDL